MEFHVKIRRVKFHNRRWSYQSLFHSLSPEKILYRGGCNAGMINRRWVLCDFRRRNERELFSTFGDDSTAPANCCHDQDQASSVLLHWTRRRLLRRPRFRSHGMDVRRLHYATPILFAAVWNSNPFFVHEFCASFLCDLHVNWLWFLDLFVFNYLWWDEN